MVHPVHALAGSDTSTAQFPAVHDTVPARTAWTWRRVLLAGVLAADLVYATLVFASIFGAGWRQWLPQPAAGFITGTLVGATIVAVSGVRYARVNDRLDECWVTFSALAANLTDDMASVKGVVQEIAAEVKRIPEAPTVPLGGRVIRPRPHVAYGSVAAATVNGGHYEVALQRVVERLDAIEGQIVEFGNQRWFSGHAAGFEDGSGSGGSVRTLTPRAGRSTS